MLQVAECRGVDLYCQTVTVIQSKKTTLVEVEQLLSGMEDMPSMSPLADQTRGGRLRPE